MQLNDTQSLRDAFAQFAQSSDKERAAAFDLFCSVGLPDKKTEEWKYSALRALAELDVAFTAPAPAINESEIEAADPGFDADRILCVDGIPMPITESKYFSVKPLAQAAADKSVNVDQASHPFFYLNKAFGAEGIRLETAENSQNPKPIHLLYLQTGKFSAVQPRVVIDVKQGSSVSVIEHFISFDSGSRYLLNSVAEFHLAKDARVRHFLLQENSSNVFHINGTYVEQSSGSDYQSTVISLNGEFIRNDLNIEFTGEHAENRLFGLYLPDKGQHIDNHTSVSHSCSHCRSEEYYKGIIGADSKAVFNGRVFVAENTVQTTANQMNKNLLLSENSEIDTKPELEIYTEDVACSHGATVGQLDEESLFYLRTRGLSRKAAETLLLDGFACELLEEIDFNDVKEYLQKKIIDKLHRIN